MSSLVSGNNAKSGYNSSYSGSTGRVRSSAGIAVLPKKKEGAAVKKGRASSKTVKKKKKGFFALSAAAVRKHAKADKRVRYALIALLASVAVMLSFTVVIFGSNVSHYSDHFYENTVINGIDVSEMTLAEAEEAMQTMVNDYAITVTDFEGRSYYAGAAVFGLDYVDDGSLLGILESQNPLLWPFKEGAETDYDIADSIVVDRGMLESWVSSLDCSAPAVMPKDAYVAQDADGFYYIEPEVYGNTVDIDAMCDIIEHAVKTGVPYISMTDSDTYCYLKPSVYSTDTALHEQMAAGNEEVKAFKELQQKILDLTNVSVAIPGQNETYLLDQEALFGWIAYRENGEPYLDTSKAYSWVDSYAQANGLTGSNCLFRTHGGYVVTVDQGPYSGWAFDSAATADLVVNALNTKTSGNIQPVMVSPEGIAQSADSYIEISLTDQMMWYYQNGNVVLETPIVSGNVVADLETPSNGVWAVEYKATDYLMMAPLREDGSREYEVVVNYWIPFNNGVGIHDLGTRDEFGGDIYIRDGSHGCINTPLDIVAQLYDLVSTGTKVVVHGS